MCYINVKQLLHSVIVLVVQFLFLVHLECQTFSTLAFAFSFDNPLADERSVGIFGVNLASSSKMRLLSVVPVSLVNVMLLFPKNSLPHLYPYRHAEVYTTHFPLKLFSD